MFAVAALCIAVPALAEVSPDFIQANRCAALARSSKFDSPDARAYKAFVDSESKGRNISSRNRARMAQSLAKQEALTATGEKKAALEAELNGACQAFKTQVAAN